MSRAPSPAVVPAELHLAGHRVAAELPGHDHAGVVPVHRRRRALHRQGHRHGLRHLHHGRAVVGEIYFQAVSPLLLETCMAVPCMDPWED